ncbi:MULTISPECIES: hypothetical protein [unclassified Streptococcus]|uniref:hypothetical protein n=1 Tax=unclassified Streptococcus TaxID=2608887 RepID=UPI00110271E1|nr:MULTISPECIES: hypothetical protein [unclassified Streptococcus]MBF0806780.1 hypothetical protein [Streptococcus sp. 19428wA2_WM07]TFU25892.1 hypothetical protein E4T71_08385 [Streptococcus sp. WM07]
MKKHVFGLIVNILFLLVIFYNFLLLEFPLGLGINTVALLCFLALLKETLRKLLQGIDDE